jgi:integrase
MAARTGVENPENACFLRQNTQSIAQQNAQSRTSAVMNCYEKTRLRKPLIFKAGNVPIKIYQSRSRRYVRFVVAYYLAGKRVLRTFGKLYEAKARAKEVVSAIVRDQLGALRLTNIDRYATATAMLEPLGIPLHAAVEEYVSARTRLNGHPLLAAIEEYTARRQNVVDKRVREVVDELIARKQSDRLSRRYVQTLRHHLHRFASAFETSISSITAKLIDDWLRSEKTLSPRGRNNFRMSIITLFHFARSRGYLPKNEAIEADAVPKAKDRDGAAIGIFTPSQLANLLAAVKTEEARLYFSLGAFTGIRSAELIRLDWRDFNFSRAHVEVGKNKAKTATRRLVPIQPNLMSWIAPYRERATAGGRVFVSYRAAERSIAVAKEMIGKWPKNALRHSYGTYRLAQCQDAARVALEMGNSPQMLFRHYRELADEQDATAWFSISPTLPGNMCLMREQS